MKILVIGGAGFIGTNLIKKLLEQSHSIICMDNLYSGQKANVDLFSNNKNFQFIHHDITNPIDSLDVEQIYHLACPASPIHYQRSSLFTFKTSVLGTLNVLELASRINARVLFSSTSEIYGNPLQHPQSESYFGNTNTIGPRSCYDEGKRAAETLCYEYKKKGLDVRIVRIFNTYGPYMDKNDGRVVSNFIIQALKNQPITIYGNGEQTRSFCYVDDLVNALIKFMSLTIAFFGPINLGNPGEFTIKELATQILELTNSKNQLIFKELPVDDPEKRKPDISRAIEILGWQPEILLKEGLAKTIEYFQGII